MSKPTDSHIFCWIISSFWYFFLGSHLVYWQNRLLIIYLFFLSYILSDSNYFFKHQVILNVENVVSVIWDGWVLCKKVKTVAEMHNSIVTKLLIIKVEEILIKLLIKYDNLLWHRKKQTNCLYWIFLLTWIHRSKTLKKPIIMLWQGKKVIFSQTDGEGILEKVDLMHHRCNEYINSANFLCNYCLILV